MSETNMEANHGTGAMELVREHRLLTVGALAAGALMVQNAIGSIAKGEEESTAFASPASESVAEENARLDEMDCRYQGYSHRTYDMNAEASISDPRELGKVIIDFHEAWSHCPEDIEVSTRARLRTLGEGQTKWRVGEYGTSTWGKSSDGKTAVTGTPYGMKCDTQYRDYIKARPQLENTITQTQTTSTGEVETVTRVEYQTAPMSEATTIKCK